jgi:hypothetical protein
MIVDSHVEIWLIERLLGQAGFSEEEKALAFGGNIAKLLGMMED